MNKDTLELLMNYVVLIGIVLIVLSSYFLVSYYFAKEKESCTNSPFVYGAKKLREQYPDVTIIGQLIFTKPGVTISPVYFDETGIKKEEKIKKINELTYP